MVDWKIWMSMNILTFMELDNETMLLYGAALQLFCFGLLPSYQHSGEKYLPQTIESVDVETLEAYVSSYRQLLAENNQLVQ